MLPVHDAGPHMLPFYIGKDTELHTQKYKKFDTEQPRIFSLRCFEPSNTFTFSFAIFGGDSRSLLPPDLGIL